MKLNRTVLRTVEILALASESVDGVTLDEICDRLKIPKTSAYDIVTTLSSTGMLRMEKGSRQRYRVGLHAYQIGVTYTNHMNLKDTLEPVMKKLAAETQKTVFFGVLSEDEIVYVSKVEPENPIITTATVGSRNPVYCTSLGKAILAEESEKVKQEVFRHLRFEQRTARTIASCEELQKELQRVKERGYAFDDREVEEHMKCVGAAVFEKEGKIAGALSISGLYRPDEDYDALGKLVRQRARELSVLLGYRE
ncbi:MAG: IclR family transcriptional regulator [bacterium]|nr:IclR family transcriptional regulator [bacterium]